MELDKEIWSSEIETDWEIISCVCKEDACAGSPAQKQTLKMTPDMDISGNDMQRSKTNN